MNPNFARVYAVEIDPTSLAFLRFMLDKAPLVGKEVRPKRAFPEPIGPPPAPEAPPQ